MTYLSHSLLLLNLKILFELAPDSPILREIGTHFLLQETEHYPNSLELPREKSHSVSLSYLGLGSLGAFLR